MAVVYCVPFVKSSRKTNLVFYYIVSWGVQKIFKPPVDYKRCLLAHLLLSVTDSFLCIPGRAYISDISWQSFTTARVAYVRSSNSGGILKLPAVHKISVACSTTDVYRWLSTLHLIMICSCYFFLGCYKILTPLQLQEHYCSIDIASCFQFIDTLRQTELVFSFTAGWSSLKIFKPPFDYNRYLIQHLSLSVTDSSFCMPAWAYISDIS